jgi:hypothetical protein
MAIETVIETAPQVNGSANIAPLSVCEAFVPDVVLISRSYDRARRQR